MKIVTFSDTHNLHDQVILPPCDIAICAGDFTGRGNRIETSFFMRWFAKQNQCVHKVMTIGNHDICFDPKHDKETHAYNWLPGLIEQYKNLHILNDSYVNIKGINIWGSPATPWYHGDRWGHNYKKADIIDVWEKIPNDTDILITHGPAFGILDTILDGRHVGCISLLDKIKEIKPKYHICGHIHEAYGTVVEDDTIFVNCSIVDVDYYPTNKPVEMNY